MSTGTATPTNGVVLTADLAAAIYRAKETKTRYDSALLAARFGITAKAIRDIWNRRTWPQATMHLWTPEETKAWLQSIMCPACRDLDFNSVANAVAVACSVCSQRIRRKLKGSYSADTNTAQQTKHVADFEVTTDWDLKDIDCPCWDLPEELAQAAETSKESAAKAFPRAPVFTDVKFDADGWLIDPRVIGYFLSNKGRQTRA